MGRGSSGGSLGFVWTIGVAVVATKRAVNPNETVLATCGCRGEPSGENSGGDVKPLSTG